MLWRICFSVVFIWCSAIHAEQLQSEAGREEKYVWWQGQAYFKGQVIIPACTLAMNDTYQEVDMGYIPIRDLHSGISGPEREFRLQLRNCELVKTGSHIRVTFDGSQGEKAETFLLSGQAKGVELQILDNHGCFAYVGKAMHPLLLDSNDYSLDYTLRIVRNGHNLKSGEYYAVLRFKIDYE